MRLMLVLTLLLVTTAAHADCTAAETKARPRLSAPVAGNIVRGFGMTRPAPTVAARFHSGVDYAVPVGEPVRAAAAGQVSAVLENDQGYGKYVRIAHGGGAETAYAHLSAFNVRTGDCVRTGDVIGRSGENSIGPMLHFEVLQNQRFLDPYWVLKRDAQKQ